MIVHIGGVNLRYSLVPVDNVKYFFVEYCLEIIVWLKSSRKAITLCMNGMWLVFVCYKNVPLFRKLT